jgi:hypothetical protein
MKLRTLLFCFAVCSVIDATLAWRERARREPAADAALIDQPMVDSSALDQARRIVVREKPQSRVLYSNGDGFEVSVVVDAHAPVRETILERDRSGRWVVANYFGLEADPTWLGQTMRDLSQGRLIRRVTGDPRLMAELDLNAAQVRFEDGAGRDIRQLDFGRKDSADTQFVRVNQGEAFLAKHSAVLVGDPLAWIETRVLDFDPAEVCELDLPFRDRAEPPLDLRRAARGGSLTLKGKAMPAGAVATAERILARLLNSPVMSAVAIDAPAAEAARRHIVARIRMVLFDGRSYRVDFGSVPKDAGGPDGNRFDALVFAFYECSDPRDLAVRYSAKATLAYNRGTTLDQLPASRAKFFASPADLSH